MSQLCSSFHLRSRDVQDGINLLEKCNMKGYVFPVQNNWITLVTEEDIGENHRLIKQNEGLLLHYNFSEDFGWGFSVYNGQKEVCTYECLWCGPMFDANGELLFNEDGELIEIDNVQINDKNLKENVLLDLLGNDRTKMHTLQAILRPQTSLEAIQNNVSLQFAKLLGIENVDWISYQYIDTDPSIYQNIISI